MCSSSERNCVWVWMFVKEQETFKLLIPTFSLVSTIITVLLGGLSNLCIDKRVECQLMKLWRIKHIISSYVLQLTLFVNKFRRCIDIMVCAWLGFEISNIMFEFAFVWLYCATVSMIQNKNKHLAKSTLNWEKAKGNRAREISRECHKQSELKQIHMIESHEVTNEFIYVNELEK